MKESLKVIRIELPKFLDKYSHRDYLGGIMKLGIKREKIGDILTRDNGADIIVISEISDILKIGLEELKRFSKSKINILNIEELIVTKNEQEEFNIIVPSMRLDSIISELAKISRAKASNILKEERVFINFELIKDNSKIVKLGDIITIRGKGRFNILEILGNTKKDKILLKISKK